MPVLDPYTKQRIAVVRLGALGDVCMATPLVAALVRSFPKATIDWIIDRANLPLVEGFEGCGFIAIDKPRSIGDYVTLYKQFSSYHYDILLVIQASFRSNCVSRCLRAKDRYGFGRLHSRDGQYLFVNRYVNAYPEHLVDANMRFAQALGATDVRVRWSLPVCSNARAWVKQRLKSSRPCVLVVLSSSKAERDWPIDHYKILINQMMQLRKIQILLIGGSSQRERCRAEALMRSLIDHQCIQNWVGQTNIAQFKAIIAHAQALISPDTSAVHVAVALGTPVVGLYAVAPAAKTGPYGANQWCVDRYDLAVKTWLKKDPARVSWRQRVHHPKAMSLISVDDVLCAVKRLFKTISC